MNLAPARSWLTGLLLLVASAVPALAQDVCEAPRLLTPVGMPLARDGFAIVVADTRAAPSGEIALVRGRRRTPLARAEIMPGLVRYSATVRPGTYRLEGVSAPSDIVVSSRATRPAPAVAPVIRGARRVARAALGSTTLEQELHIELGYPVPDRSVAARIQWNESGEGGQWVPVVAGEAAIIVPVEPPCRAPGMTPAPSGAFTLRAAFIDASGQVSAFSTSVQVD
jgi:hypothetical protein